MENTEGKKRLNVAILLKSELSRKLLIEREKDSPIDENDTLIKNKRMGNFINTSSISNAPSANLFANAESLNNISNIMLYIQFPAPEYSSNEMKTFFLFACYCCCCDF